MADEGLAGKFGAPPADDAEHSTFKQEWMGFFNKLKSDPNMQQALLGFAANVTQPNDGGTAGAVTGAINSAVGGYKAMNERDADRKLKQETDAERLVRERAEHTSQIANEAVQRALGRATTDRTRGQMEGDAATAENTRVSTTATTNADARQENAAAGERDLTAAQAEALRAQAARDKAVAAAGGGGKAAKPSHLQLLAASILAKGQATDENDAYLKATEMDKNPTTAKIVQDFIATQGFMYPDNLDEKVAEIVELSNKYQSTAGGKPLLPSTAPATGTPAGATPGITGTTVQPRVDMGQLRLLADQFQKARGLAPVSEAKLLEISQNPALIQQLNQRSTANGR